MTQATEYNGSGIEEIVGRLRAMAVRSLARMYRRRERRFAFRLRREGSREVLEGISRRYTATVLIGLAGEDRQVAAEVLGGDCPQDICESLVQEIHEMQDLGEVSLTTWAARALGHSKAPTAIDALRRMEPGQRPYPTMELSWALSSLVADGCRVTDMKLAEAIAQALLASFTPESGIFRHRRAGSGRSKWRAHVSCFADFVYPVQALSYYYLTTGDIQAGEAARGCARQMCRLQGPAGQWWWHYDCRSGRVIERYPVYSVHQDAMAPMALSALARACRQDHSSSVEKGLRWLQDRPEKVGPLIDLECDVIWRKVARREPNRLVRGLQAAASGLHPRLRVPGVDALFPPVVIDYESRPYHMGWILHAWPANRNPSTTQLVLSQGTGGTSDAGART
jgi:hypothetical protein